jgi:hypothetical protein
VAVRQLAWIDTELDTRVRSAFLSVEEVIEKRVKPTFPELWEFTTQMEMRRLRPAMIMTQLYEHQYEPYEMGIIAPVLHGTNLSNRILGFKDLPWMEIASRFEDPELPSTWENFRIRRPPDRLAAMLTTVYSNHIEGTSIYLEVRIASPNTNLVNDLRNALSVATKSP